MPQSTPPISVPAGYVPAFALGYSDQDSKLALVSDSQPLPIRMQLAAAPAALQGTATSSTLAGPFPASAEIPITLSLDGSWTGTAQLLRSIDGGATKLPLLAAGLPWGIQDTNGCEQLWVESEAGVQFYLDIALVSGSLNYRVSQ